MSLYGIETWSDRADAFSVYFGLFALMAPLRWADGRSGGASPFVGAIRLEIVPGTIALLVVMIGSTSFDGFSNGTVWICSSTPTSRTSSRASACRWRPPAIYVGRPSACSATIADRSAASTGSASLGMHSIGAGYGSEDLARRFAHTLLPISIGYVVAHYFSLLVFTGQYMIVLDLRPARHRREHLRHRQLTT